MAGGVVERAAQAIHNAGGAFNRGLQAATAPWDTPGPVQKVSPFERGTVTPGAIALKSLASLIYGVRGAANARLAAQNAASVRQYRGLQIQALDKKVNEPTQSYPVPGAPGRTLNLTDTEASHSALLRPARAAADPRVHVPADYASQLQVPYDAATGTASSRDVSTGAARRLHALVNDRITSNERTSQSRLLESQHALGAVRALSDLDKQETDAADAYAEQMRPMIEANARLLQNTDPEHAAARAQAARRLGVGPALAQPDLSKPEKVPMLGPGGVPIYDSAQIPGAITRAMGAAKQIGLTRARQANAAKRAALSNVHATMSGADLGAPEATPSAGDPVLDALDALSRTYAPQQQAPPEGDPYYDKPAP